MDTGKNSNTGAPRTNSVTMRGKDICLLVDLSTPEAPAIKVSLIHLHRIKFMTHLLLSNIRFHLHQQLAFYSSRLQHSHVLCIAAKDWGDMLTDWEFICFRNNLARKTIMKNNSVAKYTIKMEHMWQIVNLPQKRKSISTGWFVTKKLESEQQCHTAMHTV